jgi:membrane-associated protein
MPSFDQIIPWLLHYKYLALFPLTVVEGPIITVVTGFFASLGYINFFIAYIVIVAGDLVGDVLHYLFGRIGGRKVVDRWGKFFGVHQGHIDALEKQYAIRGSKLLFLGKMSHGVGGAFLIGAGIIKMPFDKFFFSNMLATFIKSLILLLVGFYFGHAYKLINSILEKIALATIAIFILSTIAYFFYVKRNGDNNTTSHEQS